MKAGAWNAFACANAAVVFHILLVAKIETRNDWSWPVVFIPLWISFVFFFAFLAWLLKSRGGAFGEILWLSTGGSLLLLFSIILPVKLNDLNSSVNWYGVFVPFWLALGVFLLLDEGWPKYKHTFSTKNFDNGGVWERYLVIFPKHFLTAFAVYALLHAIHLESHVHISWLVRFCPFIIASSLFMLATLSNLTYYNEDDKFSTAVIPFLCALPFIAFEILLLLYLNGKLHSFAVANIPIFLLDVVLWMGSCVVSCLLH